MDSHFTAVIQRDGAWWIGWIEEIPGVNSQGASREELLDNLRSALREAIELNRAEALGAVQGDFQEESILV
jgi:predicted RNase H-like HicB family nuclease